MQSVTCFNPFQTYAIRTLHEGSMFAEKTGIPFKLTKLEHLEIDQFERFRTDSFHLFQTD